MLGMDLPKVLLPLLPPAETASSEALSLDRSASQTSLALIESEDQRVASTRDISAVITEHERRDLDEVFFDRVHPVLPLIYRRRCHGWIDQPCPGKARACLRSLYADTWRLLEGYTITSKENIEPEYIQVWLLLGFYKHLRVGEDQAMLTAARSSRPSLSSRSRTMRTAFPSSRKGGGHSGWPTVWIASYTRATRICPRYRGKR
jgi:hypothetical protein